MADDNRPPESEDTRPLRRHNPESDASDGDGQPPSRIDRLMSARERAEQEAARWSELGDRGEPVPSQDQPHPGPTQPVRPVPPPTDEDTPTGQDTPTRGLPPLPGAQASATTAQEAPNEPPASTPRPYTPPPFPHPTDPPDMHAASAPGPVETPAGPETTPQDDLLAEPPIPDDIDATRLSQPGQPIRLDDVPDQDDTPIGDDTPVPADSMPLPRDIPFEDLDATMVGRSAYRDPLDDESQQNTMPHRFTSLEEPPPPEQSTVPSSVFSSQQPSPPAASGPSYPEDQTLRAPSTFVAPERRAEPLPPPPPRARREAPPQRPPARKKRRARQRRRLSWGCVPQAIMGLIVAAIVALMVGGGGAAIYYSQVTAPAFRGINTVADLQEHALQFETTRIRDREGNILYQLNDPNGGFRDYVPLEEISPWVIVATIATEERAYFINPGFSIPGIVRAVVQNYREGAVVSGASTITQQLTRALLLPEDERTEVSYDRKVKEIFLAAELGRRFSKEDVLELYLNQIYYGNLAYGIEAAAQTYFNKSAKDLNMAEASFLAGLPQSPAVYDPVINKELALGRQQQVLRLMLEAGCIERGGATSMELPCTTPEAIEAAQPDIIAIVSREFQRPNFEARYPHWVVYVQQQLEALVGPAIYSSGFDVYTTLDPRLQDAAQAQVDAVLTDLVDRNVNNASVIVTDVHTGAILAMVGSRDFYNEAISGQVNVALTPQQPGSSIKPFTYLAAFRQDFTPATVIWDVPIAYDIPGFGTYEPVNYSGRFNGPVTARFALANSLNIPAVVTLDHVGVPALLQVLNDVGITSLGDASNPFNYGLSLTLGAGEVYLVDWTNAFATIANGGTYRPTYAIERIERDGVPIEGYPYPVPQGTQAIDPGHAYLMQSILSDKVARIPSFGENTPISPPYPAGAKTGTTNDFRDNWTMGFTTEIAVGVWVGNTDNSPMLNVTGVTGAGPIWRAVMDAAAALPEYAPQEFPRPASVFPQTVCLDDGTLAANYQFCNEHSQTHVELFTGNVPGEEQRLYRQLTVDSFTGLLVSEYCADYPVERTYLTLPNHSQLIDMRPFIRNWLFNTELGQGWLAARSLTDNVSLDPPPEQACGPDVPRPALQITEPGEGAVIENVLTVRGTVDAPNFSHYRVEFGVSHDPIGWGVVQGDTAQRITNDVLGQINLTGYEEGPMTVRVLVFDTAGNSAEQRVRFYLEKVEPTPEPEPDEGDAGQDEAGQQPVQPIQPGEGAPAEPTTTPQPSWRDLLDWLRGNNDDDD